MITMTVKQKFKIKHSKTQFGSFLTNPQILFKSEFKLIMVGSAIWKVSASLRQSSTSTEVKTWPYGLTDIRIPCAPSCRWWCLDFRARVFWLPCGCCLVSSFQWSLTYVSNQSFPSSLSRIKKEFNSKPMLSRNLLRHAKYNHCSPIIRMLTIKNKLIPL